MFGLFSERRRAAEAMEQERHKNALDQVFQATLPEEVALAMVNHEKRLNSKQKSIDEEDVYRAEIGAILSDLIDAGNTRDKDKITARHLVKTYLESIDPNITPDKVELFVSSSVARARKELSSALESGAIEVE